MSKLLRNIKQRKNKIELIPDSHKVKTFSLKSLLELHARVSHLQQLIENIIDEQIVKKYKTKKKQNRTHT